LLQARGDEGRGRILAALFALDRGDPQAGLRQQRHDFAGLAFVESAAFSPSSRTTRAANGGGALPSTCASMVQYSSGRKALISASRSTTRRTATDCTRPADSPRRTLDHSTGLIS
jgi:hypothetical protein